MKKIILLLFLTISLSLQAGETSPKREFRGTWISTVANIDWPQKPSKNVEAQKAELCKMLDELHQAGINAVFFQARCECDALYKSDIEPWSYYLTGKQGTAPKNGFDPLAFAITEAHKRSMELHAWLNPYRALRDTRLFIPAANHVTNLHPDWILKFGNLKILNPGLPEVRSYVLSVVRDIVRRYDVDGIHFDDYFYPYEEIKNEDSTTFANYHGNYSDIRDWRRNNVNSLMKEIYGMIQQEKPLVKFGISPFGIVKNSYAGTNGFDAYNILCCDPLSWLDGRYVDYINPQIYWAIGHKRAAYEKLLKWWPTVLNGRHLYAGQNSVELAAPDYKGRKSEIGDQIRLNRATENVGGEVFFSAKSICKSFGTFKDTLRKFYAYPALPPRMTWKDSIPPLSPTNLKVARTNAGLRLKWTRPSKASDSELPQGYILYRFLPGEEKDRENATHIIAVLSKNDMEFLDSNVSAGKTYIYLLSSFDRMKNESSSAAQLQAKF